MNDNIQKNSHKKEFRERPVSCNVFGPVENPDDLEMCDFMNFFPSICSNSSMNELLKIPNSENLKLNKNIQKTNNSLPKTSFVIGSPNSRSLESFRIELRNMLYMPYTLIYQKLEKLIPEIGLSGVLDTLDRIRLANIISFLYYPNSYFPFESRVDRPISLLKLALDFERTSNRQITIRLNYLNNVNTIFYFMGERTINMNGNEMTKEETYFWRIIHLDEREKMMSLNIDIFLTELGL